jgi:ribosome-binding protein aMBF1 (putative translation factor)
MTEDEQEIATVSDADTKPKAKRVRGIRSPTPRDLVPEFAELVRRKRLEQVPTMSQRTLASAAGVSPMCVSEVESMKRSPSLRVAAQLARALRMDIKLYELVVDGQQIDVNVNRVKRRTVVRTTRKQYFRKKKKVTKAE